MRMATINFIAKFECYGCRIDFKFIKSVKKII